MKNLQNNSYLTIAPVLTKNLHFSIPLIMTNCLDNAAVMSSRAGYQQPNQAMATGPGPDL